MAPGLMSVVQDEGRPGWEHVGVPRGGALDFPAYCWANRLADNPFGEALVEALLTGPILRVSEDAWVATAGAGEVYLEDRHVPSWAGFQVPAGSTVSIRGIEGARAYIAFHGGIDTPLVLGSRSTNLESGFGGYAGRALLKGDLLPLGAAGTAPCSFGLLRHPAPPVLRRPVEVRVVAGPRREEFSAAALTVLLMSTYRMSPMSNHVGIRLEGPRVESRSRGDRISEPMPVGGIQVTPGGQPVVLLNSRGTIGGYPVIATAVSTDVWRLGQLRPGDEVRFFEVGVEEAQEIARQAYAELEHVEALPEAGPALGGG